MQKVYHGQKTQTNSLPLTQKKKTFFGRSKGTANAHKKLTYSNFQPNFTKKPLKDLPTEVDWRKKGVVTKVKDQGSCGSCWAFGSTAVIESHVALQTGKLFELSVQQVAMCTPNPKHCGGTGGCEGSVETLAFEYATGSNGIYLNKDYPYKSYGGTDYDCELPTEASPVASINGFVRLPANDYLALMNAVATVGPISVSVDATTWSRYRSGIFDGCNQKNPDGNHAVVLVGYGEENGKKYWIVRNSWSESYGERGYIRVARSDADDERCGMDITPQHGSACEGDEEPVKMCGACGIIAESSYPLNAGTK